ncbi:MAG: hypothetical protein K1X66_06645 [Verrucomicrobiae bacterium]|nr:hypothetical protein [Verrucomicrobiae bacterium]
MIENTEIQNHVKIPDWLKTVQFFLAPTNITFKEWSNLVTAEYFNSAQLSEEDYKQQKKLPFKKRTDEFSRKSYFYAIQISYQREKLLAVREAYGAYKEMPSTPVSSFTFFRYHEGKWLLHLYDVPGEEWFKLFPITSLEKMQSLLKAGSGRVGPKGYFEPN